MAPEANVFDLGAGALPAVHGAAGLPGQQHADPYTTVDVDGSAKARVSHPWMVVAGVAFLWRYVHLTLGAGYGYYFIPGVNLPYPNRGFVPDASVAVIL